MDTISQKNHLALEKLTKDIKAYLPNFDKKIFLRAFEFAEKAHKGQIRKDGITPYIVHPVRTVEILAKLHADQDTLISALLHDVPEDTDHDIAEVETIFGKNVAFLVEGVTKLSKVHYQNDMPGRSIESLKKLFIHTAKDPRVIIIKLADRLHNMRTLEFVKPDKQVRIARETLSIYVPVANLLGIQEIKRQLEELCFKHLFPTEYDQLFTEFSALEIKSKKLVDTFLNIVRKILKKGDVKAKVFPRKHKLYNIYKKLSSTGRTIDDIDNRIRISIVVDSISDCYHVLGLIHSHFVPKTDRFRDYIANPKVNGYRSLHTVVFGIDGVLTEVHISSHDMHLESEYGIAARFFEKTNGSKEENGTLNQDKRSQWVTKVVDIDKGTHLDDYMENLKSDFFQDRIFVFTPKGSTIDLPKGATAIDFAYAIHTEVGRHALKAKINDELRPITSGLKTGDVVKILTHKESFPELYWLNFSKTHFAKNRIKAYFKRVSKEKKIKAGNCILQKEFDIDGLGLLRNFSFKKLRAAFLKQHNKNFLDWNELFIAIGSGDLKASTVVHALTRAKQKAEENETKLFGLFRKNKTEGMKVGIKIVAKDRFGLMQEIVNIVYKYSLNMTYFKGWASTLLDYAYFYAQVTLPDQESISKVFDELEQIDGVMYVNRVIYKGLYLFYAVLFATAALWLSHPYILNALLESNYFRAHNLLSTVFFYVGFFMLLLMVLFVTHLARKYFPSVRNQKRLWIISFTVLTIAIAALIAELFYLKMNISWIALMGGVLLLYVYLGMNFRKTKY